MLQMRKYIQTLKAQNHGHRKGLWIPLDFEIFSKKAVSLVLGGKQQISPLLAPLGKNLSDAHAQNTYF